MPDLFIEGEWRSARGGRERDIHCPADGTHVVTVDEAGPEDTLDAIAAARRAFDEGPWPGTPVQERSALLHKVADLLVANKAEVARAESLDTGKRLVESEYDVDDIVGVFRHYANIAAEDAGRVVDTGQATSAAGSCTSRSGSARSSRRGTIPCSRPAGRSRPAWPQATPSSSSRVS